MDLSKNTSHYSAAGTDHTPEVHVEFLNNPITYEIVLIIAIVSFAMLVLKIFACLLPCIAPDDYSAEEDSDDEQEDQPRDFTLTEDGALLDNESGHPRQYGTFYTHNGHWYNADGYVSY